MTAGDRSWGAVVGAFIAVVLLVAPAATAGVSPQSQAEDLSHGSGEIPRSLSEQEVGLEHLDRLFAHLPAHLREPLASGPASVLGSPPDGLGGILETIQAQAKTSWEPVPIPEVPVGPEPLLTAIQEYAEVAGLDLPELAGLRAQIEVLRMQLEAEDALSRLVRAYSLATELEAQATDDLTDDEIRLLSDDPETVAAWFDKNPGRDGTDLRMEKNEILSRLDMASRIQAADLLLRAVEATKDAIALPPRIDLPIDVGPAMASTPPALPSERMDDQDIAWDRLHAVVSIPTLEAPVELPDLPQLDLQTSLTLLAGIMGRPMDEPFPLGPFAGMPPSMSDAVSKVVTARAIGLLSGDTTLHTRLILNAVQEAQPTFEAWAAIQQLHQRDVPVTTRDTVESLRGMLATDGSQPFTSIGSVQPPPSLAELLQREGVGSHEAREAEWNLPEPVALGTAYALAGIQAVDKASNQAFAGLSSEERDLVNGGADRITMLMEADEWTDDEAALIKAWAQAMSKIDGDDLRNIHEAQMNALASVEVAAGILRAYAATSGAPAHADAPQGHGMEQGAESMPSGQTAEGEDPPEDKPTSWLRRALAFVADFQIIGSANAQPLPLPPQQCRNHSLSDCSKDVWLDLGAQGILITGFEQTIVDSALIDTPLLIIDLGGDDIYLQPVGAGGAGVKARISVLLDMGGDDTYDTSSTLAHGAADGLGTLGILWDDSGHDTYRHDCDASVCGAQGYGSGGGLGVLVDRDGSDVYEAIESRAHGVGWGVVGGLGGIGILLDHGRGADTFTAGRGQGYAHGSNSVGMLINDGDGDANEYRVLVANARYQGGRDRDGQNVVGLLLDLGGVGTFYSGFIVPEGSEWTYMSFHDDPDAGERTRKDDALWMEQGSNAVGIGIDTRRGDDDGDRFDNWVELLAGSDPQDPASTPIQTAVGSIIETILGLIPDTDNLDPEELVPDEGDLDDPTSFLEGPAQRDDALGCAVEYDEDNECDTPMALLHVGTASDDIIDAPALVLIELGGDDTYTAEVAGPGDFYRLDEGIQTKVAGVGSIAIDVGGNDTYLDSGGPTQGAITLSNEDPADAVINPPFNPKDGAGILGWLLQAPGCGDDLTCHGLTDLLSPTAEEVNPMVTPVSLLLDLSGDDEYYAGAGSQGAAMNSEQESCAGGTLDPLVCLPLQDIRQPPGAAWLIDFEGDDRYTGGENSQGAVRLQGGQAGLVDLSGDDHYQFLTQAAFVDPVTVSNRHPSTLALLYDGSGQDTYDNTVPGAPVVDTDAIDPENLNAAGTQAAFATQGRGLGGVFIDEGPHIDAYLVHDQTNTVVDLGWLKNSARIAGQSGFFFDGQSAIVSPEDGDGDGAPNVVETVFGTNPYDPEDHAGSIWGACNADNVAADCTDDAPGAWLRIPGGLMIGGHDDTLYTESFPFMVSLGGNNTYTAPGIGGLGLVLDAGTGDTQYLPGGADGGCRLEGTQQPSPFLMSCPGSLGGAKGGIAILADGGGNNTFLTEHVMDIASHGDWTFDMVAQGAASERGFGAVVTWDASNRFTANLTARVDRDEFQTDSVTSLTVISAVQGAGWEGGVGLLVNLGNGSDHYELNIATGGDALVEASVGVAQGAASEFLDTSYDPGSGTTPAPPIADSQRLATRETTAMGLLFDEGGDNRFQAPHTAQGSAVGHATLGALWSGPGDDVFVGGPISQGAALGTLTSTPIALLYDAGGHDEYHVLTPEGSGPAYSQGAGLLGGIGVLVDIAGDDRYHAEGAQSVQGVGAEGIGALLDLGGNDQYLAGDHAQAFASDLYALRRNFDTGGATRESGDYQNATNTYIDFWQDEYVAHYGYAIGVAFGGRGATNLPHPVSCCFTDLESYTNQVGWLTQATGQVADTERFSEDLGRFHPGDDAPNHRVTFALLVDLHGSDAYEVDGIGQGFADVTFGRDGVYEAWFIDGAGDDRYDHAGVKEMLQDLSEDTSTLPENDWVWTTKSPDTVQAEEDAQALLDSIANATEYTTGAQDLVDFAIQVVEEEIINDWTDGDEIDALVQQVNEIVADAMEWVDGADRLVADAIVATDNFTEASGKSADNLTDDDPEDPGGKGAEARSELDALILEESSVLRSEAAVLAAKAQALASTVAFNLTNDAPDRATRFLFQETDELVNETRSLTNQTGELLRIIVSQRAERADQLATTIAETVPVARGLGIDASHIDQAMDALYRSDTMDVTGLEVWSDGSQVTEGTAVNGSLLVRTRIAMAQPDPERIDRVTFSANNHILGLGRYNSSVSDADELVYDFHWDTSSTSFPQTYPDGDYELFASMYLATMNGVRGSAPPDLPAAESGRFDLTVDNPPLIDIDPPSMQDALISPPLQKIVALPIQVGRDSDWPPHLDAAQQTARCETTGIDPSECLPGANVTISRVDANGQPVRFEKLYLPAGSHRLDITGQDEDGTPWSDGGHTVRIDAEDAAGQVGPAKEFPVVVDASPPTSTVTLPQYASLDNSGAGGSLVLEWSFDDHGGTGVTGVCVFRFEDAAATVLTAGWPKCPGTQITSMPISGVRTGDTLHFMTAAVDVLGNTDSPCTPTEQGANLVAPKCYVTKRDASPDAVRSVTVDFDPPFIKEIQVDGKSPDEVFVQPGTPVNITATIQEEGTGFGSPGGVWVRLPARTSGGQVLPGLFEVAMETDGSGTFWYDRWHEHNADIYGDDLDDALLGITIVARDKAGNRVTEQQGMNLDNRPPLVLPRPFPQDSQYLVVDTETGEETPLLAARPGLRADIRARVVDASMGDMTLDISALTGTPGDEVYCGPDDGVADPSAWLCQVNIPSSGVPDGDYELRFNATDTAGNWDASATIMVKVRAEKLGLENITLVSVGYDHFHVNWTTAFPGTSGVEFGLNGLLGQSVRPDDQYRKQHSVNVTGLTPSTEYFFRVVSENEAGIRNASAVSPDPIITDNAYRFDLSGLTHGQVVNRNMTVDYDLTFTDGTDTPLDVTIRVQDHGADVSPFELETIPLSEGPGTLTIDTRPFADGDYFLDLLLDRAGDEAETISPTFRIDNTEPLVVPDTPRPQATVTSTDPVFVVVLIDPMGLEPPSADELRVNVDGQTFEPQIQADEVVGPSSMQRKVTFTIPWPDGEAEQGAQLLNLSVTDPAGNMGWVEWPFHVDSLPPVLEKGTQTEYDPGPNAARPSGTALLTVTLSDSSGVASADLDTSGLTGEDTSTPFLLRQDGRWAASVEIPPDAPDGRMELDVRATDAVGNQGPAGAVNLTIDAHAPGFTDTGVSNVTFTSAIIHVTTDEPTRAWLNESLQPSSGAWVTDHTLNISGLVPGKDHEVLVNIIDDAGNQAQETVTVSTHDDDQPPTGVGDLAAVSPHEGIVVMSWTRASDNAGIRSYRIERVVDSDVNATFEQAAGNTTYRDTGAPAGETVTYRVQAVDVAGLSGPSAEVSIQVLALPHLSNATVDPLKGPANQPFTFQVTYHHAGGVPADVITVKAGGRLHTLDRLDPESDCRVGCVYMREIRLPAATLFGSPDPIVFTATTDGRTDHLTLAEHPLVLRGSGNGGVVDLSSEEKSTPSVGLLTTLILLAIVAITRSHRRDHP